MLIVLAIGGGQGTAAEENPPAGFSRELPDEILAKRLPGEVYRYAGHSKAINDVAVSPRGSYLATASQDLSVSVIELSTLRVLHRLKSEDGGFACLAFSADEQTLWTGGTAEGTSERNVLLWSVADGNLRTRCVGRPSGTSSVAVSADGRKMITTHPGGLADLRLLENVGDTFPLVAHDRQKMCYDAAFSPDSRHLVTAGGDGKIFVWFVGGSIRPVSRMQTPHVHVRSVVFSRDGRFVLAGADRMITLWSSWQVEDRWQQERQFAGHRGDVTSVAVSPDNNLVASAGQDKTIRIWNLADGSTRRVLTGHSDAVTSVAFLPSGRHAVSGSLDGTVRLWRILPAAATSGGEVPERPEPGTPKLGIPDTEQLAVATGLIREIFAEEYAKAKRPDQKRQLAEQLLKQARQSENTPAERYVLLRAAHRLATQIGEVSLALGVCDEMARRFEGDEFGFKTQTVEKLSETVTGTEGWSALGESAIRIAAEALEADRYEEAERLVEAAKAAPSRVRSGELRARFAAQVQLVQRRKKFWDAYNRAKEILKSKPEDPAAHAAIGGYFCFAKGDWQKGLPHLAKGDDEQLKAVAAKDLAAPESPEKRAALGDAWRELAERSAGDRRTALAACAHYWYSKALADLTGLRKLRIERALKALGELPDDHRREDANEE
jgi:WD40 repeat protein